MARPNRLRSVEGESNLARRIQREREYRGLSYEALAKAMTEAGCSIQGSAIFKIEKGNPRRRITVDELVALAKVFDVEVENLLTPVEVLRTRRGKELLKEIEEGDRTLIDGMTRLLNAYSEYFDLAAYEPDMQEYVNNQRFRTNVVKESVESMPLGTFRVGDEEIDFDTVKLRDGLSNFYRVLIDQAGDLAVRAIEENNRRGTDGQHSETP